LFGRKRHAECGHAAVALSTRGRGGHHSKRHERRTPTIGTARAFQVSEQAGAFASLAMGLNGLLTAVLLPWLIPPLMRWLG
jgi:hypothetical protein